jgi:hypothetical protein
MANTYVKIGSTVTVGVGGAASMAFSSIPATYTDLILVYSGRTSEPTGTFYEVSLTLNGSTTGFTAKQLYGDGSSAGSSSPTSRQAGLIGNVATTSNTFSNTQVYFPNYAGSTNKSYSVDSVTENNGTTSYQSMLAGLWTNTAAINSISIAPTSGNFVQYSTATLYGISKS